MVVCSDIASHIARELPWVTVASHYLATLKVMVVSR